MVDGIEGIVLLKILLFKVFIENPEIYVEKSILNKNIVILKQQLF